MIQVIILYCDLTESLGTGQLFDSNQSSAPPRKESRHRLEKLSSPLSSTELEFSPSYKP